MYNKNKVSFTIIYFQMLAWELYNNTKLITERPFLYESQSDVVAWIHHLLIGKLLCEGMPGVASQVGI